MTSMRLPRKVLEQAAFPGHWQGRSLTIPIYVPRNNWNGVTLVDPAYQATYLEVELPILARVRRRSTTGKGSETLSSITPPSRRRGGRTYEALWGADRNTGCSAVFRHRPGTVYWDRLWVQFHWAGVETCEPHYSTVDIS